MSKSHRNLSEIQADIKAQQTAHEKAAEVRNKAQDKLNAEHEKLEALQDEHTAARTAGFDETLVKQARDLSINPDNFDNEEALATAIDTRKAEQ